MSLLAYKFRVYPSRKQKVRLINSFITCKQIYNELLSLNKDAYKFGNVYLNKFDFNKYLSGKYPDIHSQTKQNISDRVHKAFANFFRRVKEHSKEKGFPRYKSRVNSITYPQFGFKFISDKHIQVSKIGNLPIILHRIPKGKIKTLTIKQNKAGQWFATFCCELPDVAVQHPSKSKVGIDVGLESFATLSNGEIIENPHFLVKAEHRLKKLQRRVSRKVKGSANRRKARFKLARQHLKVSNIRADFLHKLSRSLTLRYCIIAGENLNIKNMVRNHHLAKHISDASWEMFMNMMSYKEVALGGQFLQNPKTRGSSHRCSGCGTEVDMPLSRRKFSCPSCFVVLHRDHNSALNHIKDTVGLTEISTPVETITPTAEQSVASDVVEAGTITTKPSTSSVVGSSTF